MHCSACAAVLPSGARFCQKCGQPVAQRQVVVPAHPGWKRWTMAVLLCFGLSLALGFILVPRNQASQGVAVGNVAPDFTLKTLDGKQVTLSQLRGKVVLLDFWATWCPPCREEMPALEAAYKKFAGPDLAFVAVDLAENDVTVGAFAQQFGITFPIALDGNGQVTDTYNILPLPTSFFIDRSGKVVLKVEQPMTQEAIEGRLAALLGRSG